MELESSLREAVALASSGAMGALLVWGYQKSIKKERLVKLSRRLGTEVRGSMEFCEPPLLRVLGSSAARG